MAMTLRLTDDQARALRTQAERENTSMHDVAQRAISDYLEHASRRALIDRVLDSELDRYADALERLGQ